MIVKIILPAAKIPLNSIVTKKNGTYEYEIVDSITIYNKEGEKQVIMADSGTRFLLSKNNPSSINAINGETELVWTIEAEKAVEYFQEITELEE